MKISVFSFLLILCEGIASAQESPSLNGFSQWRTGHDENTVQLIPAENNQAVIKEKNKTIVHVKFRVTQYGYGEVSFPINQKSIDEEEPLSTDLSKNKYIQITYQANNELILQLRQTGVHGGVHSHVTLKSSKKNTTVTIPFTEFKGGRTPLDLSNVSKFNFAFLSNNMKDGFAELRISNFIIK